MYECALKLCYLQLFAAIFSLIRSCVCVHVRKRERDRHTQRKRERDRQIERERERQRETGRDQQVANNDLTEKFKALDNCI